MNRNLFLMEFRSNATSLLLWTLVITVLIAATMSLYEVFLENNTKILAMMSILPEGTLQFKGISNVDDLFSVLGFYSDNNVVYMLVLGSIYAMVLSSGILLKEEYHKTAEFLLVWPLTRNEVFFSKASVAYLNIFIINLITTGAGYLTLEIFKKEPYSVNAFLILSFSTLLLHIFFVSLGLFMSVLVKKPRPITTLGIGLVLIFYFIYTISNITESISWIGYISPYKFLSLDVLNPGYRIESLNLLYFLGLSFILVFASYRLYRCKNIYL